MVPRKSGRGYSQSPLDRFLHYFLALRYPGTLYSHLPTQKFSLGTIWLDFQHGTWATFHALEHAESVKWLEPGEEDEIWAAVPEHIRGAFLDKVPLCVDVSFRPLPNGIPPFNKCDYYSAKPGVNAHVFGNLLICDLFGRPRFVRTGGTALFGELALLRYPSFPSLSFFLLFTLILFLLGQAGWHWTSRNIFLLILISKYSLMVFFVVLGVELMRDLFFLIEVCVCLYPLICFLHFSDFFFFFFFFFLQNLSRDHMKLLLTNSLRICVLSSRMFLVVLIVSFRLCPILQSMLGLFNQLLPMCVSLFTLLFALKLVLLPLNVWNV